MKIEEYLQLLSEGKVDEARRVRFSTIPSKLIKFIWLDESEKDEKKFLSLQREKMPNFYMNLCWRNRKVRLDFLYR